MADPFKGSCDERFLLFILIIILCESDQSFFNISLLVTDLRGKKLP